MKKNQGGQRRKMQTLGEVGDNMVEDYDEIVQLRVYNTK